MSEAKPKTRERELNPRQAAFVIEYLKDYNGKAAAIRAGYAPHSAEVAASKLLRVPKIKAQVAKVRTKIEEKGLLVVEQLDRVLQDIIDADLRDACNEKGAFLPLSEMPTRLSRALVGYEEDAFWEGPPGEKFEAGKVKKVKLASKLEALRLAYQRRGALIEKHELDIPRAVSITINGIKREPT